MDLGKTLIVFGIILLMVGLAVVFRDRLPGIQMLGHLPGDIAIERENFKFYFPITTSILVSAVASFIFWLFSKF